MVGVVAVPVFSFSPRSPSSVIFGTVVGDAASHLPSAPRPQVCIFFLDRTVDTQAKLGPRSSPTRKTPTGSHPWLFVAAAVAATAARNHPTQEGEGLPRRPVVIATGCSERPWSST